MLTIESAVAPNLNKKKMILFYRFILTLGSAVAPNLNKKKVIL
jgi:hypothetical protein